MLKWFKTPLPVPKETPLPKFPKYCRDCGKELVWQTDEFGFWEDTGEPRYRKWLHCPNYKGTRWMYRPNGMIAYEADYLDRKGTRLIGHDMLIGHYIGYTVYQTCKHSVIYRDR